jgi:hypothetical protein
MLSVIILSLVLLIVFYTEYLNYVYYAQCHYIECRYAECRGSHKLPWRDLCQLRQRKKSNLVKGHTKGYIFRFGRAPLRQMAADTLLEELKNKTFF